MDTQKRRLILSLIAVVCLWGGMDVADPRHWFVSSVRAQEAGSTARSTDDLMSSGAVPRVNGEGTAESPGGDAIPSIDPENTVVPSVSFHDIPLPKVLEEIAQRFGLKHTGIDYPDVLVTFYGRDIPLDHLLRILCGQADLACWVHEGILESVPTSVFLERYGYGFEDNLAGRIFTIHHLDLSEAKEIIQPLLSSEGRIYFSLESRALGVVDKPAVLTKIREELNERDIQTVRRTVRLRYLSASETAEALRRRFNKRVDMVIPDEAKNEILLIDDPAEIDAMVGVIKQWDRPRRMTLTLRILRVLLSEEHKRGLDWAVILSRSKPLNITDTDEQRSELVQVGYLAADDVPVLEEAIETVGTVWTGGPQQIPLSTHTEVTGRIELSATASSFSLPESGLRVEAADQENEMRASQKKTFVLKMRFEPIPDSPDVRFVLRDAASGTAGGGSVALVVPQGSVVIVGGWLMPVNVTRFERWPFLGRLPFLGGVFRSRVTETLTAETIAVFEWSTPGLDSTKE